MNRVVAVMMVLLVAAVVPSLVRGHCQVPCGIYDDPARVARLYEDAATIEKAIKQIAELAERRDAQSTNQLTRWIMTKEDHASAIITMVSEYFLAQRVKVVAAGADGHAAYLTQLADHHRVIVAAMKVKQNADLQFVVDLRAAIDGLAAYYQPEAGRH
jgi:nickel superoxide dismutase